MMRCLMNKLLLLACMGLVSATPAIVWTKSADSSSVHSSNVIDVPSLIISTLESKSSQSSLSSVIFIVGRDKDGSEALTRLSSSGALPTVEQRFDSATSVHYHLQGVEGFYSFAQSIRSSATEEKVMEMAMEEFQNRMATFGSSSESATAQVSMDGEVEEDDRAARARALASATVLIVNVSPDAPSNLLDAAVSLAIDNDLIHSVILTAVRSDDETKLVRNLLWKEKYSQLTEAHRRLNNNNNQQQQQQQQQQQNDRSTPNSVYYTSVTPNIFAGIMFFLFFIFIAFIGISCMGQISGQDVYVKSYPAIGREA